MRYIKIALVLTLCCFLLAGCKEECVHEYQSQITQPATCSAEGVETFTCVHCQDSYTTPISLLEHAYAPGAVERESTCAEEGAQTYVCADCGETKSVSIEKLAHTWGEKTITKTPNCTEEGEYSATCTQCNTTEVVEKIPTDNTHVFTLTVDRAATCTQAGEGRNTCDLCQYQESVTFDITEHPYGNPEVTKAATCTTNGSQKRTCTACSHILEETIPAKGHKWAGATCTTPGVCSVCQATGSLTPHNYKTISVAEGSQHFAGRKVQECTACGHKNTIYFTSRYTYDFEAIADVLVEYAESLGFKVSREETEEYSSRDWMVFNLDISGDGPGKLIAEGKSLIDRASEKYPTTQSKQTLNIWLSYHVSGSLGTGFFHVHVALNGNKI